MSLTRVPVRSGTYSNPDGTLLASGAVVFRPEADRVIDTTALTTMLGGAVIGTIINGVMTPVDLVATDDPDAMPFGWTWRVEELFPGGESWSITVPSAAAATGLDLPKLMPVPASPGTVGSLALLPDAVETVRTFVVQDATIPSTAAPLVLAPAVQVPLLGLYRLRLRLDITSPDIADSTEASMGWVARAVVGSDPRLRTGTALQPSSGGGGFGGGTESRSLTVLDRAAIALDLGVSRDGGYTMRPGAAATLTLGLTPLLAVSAP